MNLPCNVLEVTETGKTLHLTYASEIRNWSEINPSFDSGEMWVAYRDANRNKSYISKEVFEAAISTIYNCPIVCNYNRETDSFGGHDVEVVKDDSGIRLVNLTEPIGVIPESAQYRWETVNENGADHEYLVVDALIWKRQEGYEKLRRDGCAAESMEIEVNDGHFDKDQGLYIIDDFTFTAFCLLGDDVEPCFESASLALFSLEMKNQMASMLADLKGMYQHNQPNRDDIDSAQKGGNETLDEKMNLLKEYGLSAEDLDFSIDELTVDELKEKLESRKFGDDNGTDDEGGASDSGDNVDSADGNDATGNDDSTGEDPAEEEDEDDDIPMGDLNDLKKKNAFELCDNIFIALDDALSEMKFETTWGMCRRFWIIDFDTDKHEVYCNDVEKRCMCGMSYSMNGDAAFVDISTWKRVKYAIVDWDGEDKPDTAFALMDAFDEAYKALECEVEDLRAFKQTVDDANAQSEREEVFSAFHELDGDEAFEALRNDCAKFSKEQLEDKCYAILGRKNAKFSVKSNVQRSVKLPVGNTNTATGPYGGLFSEYGIE